MSWQTTIRTGYPQRDLDEVHACERHAASQGLALHVAPMPSGGYQVAAYVPGQGPTALVAPGCQCCGRSAPTKNVSFMWNIGAIILRFHKTLSGNFCKRCISKTFWEYMLITTFLGWWGLISFFVNLVAIPMNLIAYFGAMGLPEEWPAEQRSA